MISMPSLCSSLAHRMLMFADWQPIELDRATRRSTAFKQTGLGIHGDAEILAIKMLYRDRDSQDTRRVCFECRNFTNQNGRTSCAKGELGPNMMSLDDRRYTLCRCPLFDKRGG